VLALTIYFFTGLAEALPALDAAVKCLAKLDKSQIVEVKALKSPPAGVRLVLQAVCIMFQIKSVKIIDVSYISIYTCISFFVYLFIHVFISLCIYVAGAAGRLHHVPN